jgi:hypothetical protein
MIKIIIIIIIILMMIIILIIQVLVQHKQAMQPRIICKIKTRKINDKIEPVGWNVIVDDNIDGGDVQTATSHVRR